jgi:copper chaperone CopZ
VRLQEIVVEIRGLNGVGDEQAVARALAAIPGVRDVRVETENKRAVVTGDPIVAVAELLRAAVEGAHFEPGDIWLPE